MPESFLMGSSKSLVRRRGPMRTFESIERQLTADARPDRLLLSETRSQMTPASNDPTSFTPASRQPDNCSRAVVRFDGLSLTRASPAGPRPAHLPVRLIAAVWHSDREGLDEILCWLLAESDLRIRCRFRNLASAFDGG